MHYLEGRATAKNSVLHRNPLIYPAKTALQLICLTTSGADDSDGVAFEDWPWDSNYEGTGVDS